MTSCNRPSDRSDDPEGDAVTADGPARVSDPLTVAVTYPATDRALVRAIGTIDPRTTPRWNGALVHACTALILWSGGPAGPPRGAAGARAGRSVAAPPRVVCDLTEVTSFGVAGLTVLVELADLAHRGGIELRLVVGTPAVRRMLELTDLAADLPVEDRLVDAVETAEHR